MCKVLSFYIQIWTRIPNLCNHIWSEVGRFTALQFGYNMKYAEFD